VTGRAKKRFGKGRSPTRFSFTYEDIADAYGCSVAAVRKHAQRGKFDPSDLVSVLEFIQHRLRKDSLTGLSHQVRAAAKDSSE
jgi:uncharacterized protein YjcR